MNARQSLIAGGSIEDRSGAFRLSRSRIVRLEVTVAAALLITSFGWSWFRDLGLLGQLRPSVAQVSLGVGAALLLCLSLPFLNSTWASGVLWLREMKGVLHDVLAPLGKSLSLPEIAILAALSGLSEEIFFRGVLQAEIGIVAASLFFGLLHPINLSYVVWAATVGFAFGILYETSGSLVAPILCHGGYNFAALLYLRYWYQEEDRNHVLLAS